MTETERMLEASPADARLPLAQLAAAIDACLSCVQSCTACADANLAEENIDPLRTCTALCVTCADVCEVAARVLSRPAHLDLALVDGLLEACVHACTRSAEECARHAHIHRHCATCEQVCRACIQACSALLDAERSRR